jgi:hypothetical protein
VLSLFSLSCRPSCPRSDAPVLSESGTILFSLLVYISLVPFFRQSSNRLRSSWTQIAQQHSPFVQDDTTIYVIPLSSACCSTPDLMCNLRKALRWPQNLFEPVICSRPLTKGSSTDHRGCLANNYLDAWFLPIHGR